jgi:hypothetical protein
VSRLSVGVLPDSIPPSFLVFAKTGLKIHTLSLPDCE